MKYFIMRIINLFIIFSLGFLPLSCSGQASDKGKMKIETEDIVKPEPERSVLHMNNDLFKTKVWDYQTNSQEWIYKGDLPCIIDFYADWCGPCRRIAPLMAELATEYAGKIVIYKVNVDKENELSSFFGIQSLPSVMFCPKKGQPAIQPGALSKEQYKQIIEEFLFKKSE